MMARATVLVVVACSSAPSPVATSPHASLANASRRPRPVFRVPAPTVANAGAHACTLGDPVLLGRFGGEGVALAFDATGGLAVWRPEGTVIALQPLELAARRGAR